MGRSHPPSSFCDRPFSPCDDHRCDGQDYCGCDGDDHRQPALATIANVGQTQTLDEFEEVRLAAITSMAELSLSDDQVRNSTLDQLVDMLNDELPSVRLHTAKSLANLVESSGTENLQLPEDQLRLLLCGLSDVTLEMRRTVAGLLVVVEYHSLQPLQAAVEAFLKVLEGHPDDIPWVGSCLKALAARCSHLAECLVPKMLGNPAAFNQRLPGLDDLQYVAKLIMAFNAASIRPTIFNVMPRACIRQLPVLQIRYADLLPAMEVAEGGLGLFTIIDKSAGRPKQCEMTELDQIASKKHGIASAAAPSTAESLVHGTREALVCLGHIRPQGRAARAGWMRMATCDKHLVSATSCGCDASSTAALHVARLHLHFAAQLALAQLQVSRPRLLAGCKPRRSALPAGLNQLAVLPSSSQEARLDIQLIQQLSRLMEHGFASPSSAHRLPALYFKAVALALAGLGSVRTPAGGPGQGEAEPAQQLLSCTADFRQHLDIVGSKEQAIWMDDAVKALCTAMDKLRAGAAALEESGSTRELQDALMACWVPLPSQFAGCELVSANLRWPRASPMSFFVDFNHGMPVKLPLQVTMSSAASPDKLYVRAVMPLSTTVLRRLHPSTPVISSPKPTAQAFKTWEGEVELPGLPPLEQLEMRLGIVVLCPDGEVVALGEESSGLAIAATSLHEESKSGGS